MSRSVSACRVGGRTGKAPGLLRVGRGLRDLGHDLPRDSRHARDDAAFADVGYPLDDGRCRAQWVSHAARRALSRSIVLGKLALLGFLLLFVGNGAVAWAEQWVPSGLTAVIVASSPFWMAGTEALRSGWRTD